MYREPATNTDDAPPQGRCSGSHPRRGRDPCDSEAFLPRGSGGQHGRVTAWSNTSRSTGQLMALEGASPS